MLRWLALAALATAFFVAAALGIWANGARLALRDEVQIADNNLSIALTALAIVEAAKRPVSAAKLALAAWPRDGGDKATPKLAETLDALGQAVPNLRERLLFRDAGQFAAFSPGRVAHRHSVLLRQDRARLGRGDRQADRRPYWP